MKLIGAISTIIGPFLFRMDFRKMFCLEVVLEDGVDISRFAVPVEIMVHMACLE